MLLLNVPAFGPTSQSGHSGFGCQNYGDQTARTGVGMHFAVSDSTECVQYILWCRNWRYVDAF